MKNKILLIMPVLIIAVLSAGCMGSSIPTPTQTAIVSPTAVPSASLTASPVPTSQVVTVMPYPTTFKVDPQMTSQVSIVIGHWVESNYGCDNASLLRDVNFLHKDGDDYIYTFTVNGAPHTARISYTDGAFILLDVDNGLVV